MKEVIMILVISLACVSANADLEIKNESNYKISTHDHIVFIRYECKPSQYNEGIWKD